MSRTLSIRIFVFILASLLALSAVSSPLSAQTAATPQVGTGTAAGTTTAPKDENDDSDELPVFINITGYVQQITPTTIVINGTVINLPAGASLPSGIAVGKVVSLRGNLRNDDTILLLYIVPGYQLPTPTPSGTKASTPAATLAATAVGTAAGTATAVGTPAGTATAVGTAPVIGTAAADCGKAGQKLAVLVSVAYGVSYGQVAKLHCEGYSFGEIARAYLIVLAGKDAGKPITIPMVLKLRAEHKHWSVIIIILGVQPDSTIIIFVIDGGRITFLTDCGVKGSRKQSVLCIVSGGSGGGNGGGGKGGGDDHKHGDHGDHDDD